MFDGDFLFFWSLSERKKISDFCKDQFQLVYYIGVRWNLAGFCQKKWGISFCFMEIVSVLVSFKKEQKLLFFSTINSVGILYRCRVESDLVLREEAGCFLLFYGDFPLFGHFQRWHICNKSPQEIARRKR